MKASVICFKPSENEPFAALSATSAMLSEIGMSLGTVEFLPADDVIAFKRQLAFLRDTEDNLIIFARNADFDLKSVIADVLGEELVENENALLIAGEGEKNDYALMPSNATLIPNPDGKEQGFLCEEKEFSLAYLPDGECDASYFLESYVIPYYKEKYSVRLDTFLFKYFGDEKTLLKVIGEAAENYRNKVKKSITTKYGDSKVKLMFSDMDSASVAQVKRYISTALGDRIYADYDASLGETLFNRLRLRNLKISVAESFTGGRVVSEIIKNPGASEFVNEGIVSYSNRSKVKRLNVREETLATVGAVSSKVAYQMAAGLLTAGNCDIAVSTTGIAGPKSDNTLKPVGLNYIGVGMKDGVHVYKYELTGTREEITETAKNTALFLAIKNIKNL